MQFITADDGVLYPVSRIEKMKIKHKGVASATVSFHIDGEWHEAFLVMKNFAALTSTPMPKPRQDAFG